MWRRGPAEPADQRSAPIPSEERRTLTYLALDALAGRYATHGRGEIAAGGLSAHELRVFSQNGEDGVIEEILRRVGSGTETFVEIGAGDGREANFVFLADVLGFAGLAVEADPTASAALAAKYAATPGVRTVAARVGETDVDELVAQHAPADEPTVLSIDVDGPDWWLWRAISSVRPRVVVIEYNAALGFDRALTVPRDHAAAWDATDYHGASLPALEMLGASRGYRLVHTDLTGVNAFFVREDLGSRFPPVERVARRAPNYGLAGLRHPPDPAGRPYVEVAPELC